MASFLGIQFDIEFKRKLGNFYEDSNLKESHLTYLYNLQSKLENLNERDAVLYVDIAIEYVDKWDRPLTFEANKYLLKIIDANLKNVNIRNDLYRQE